MTAPNPTRDLAVRIARLVTAGALEAAEERLDAFHADAWQQGYDHGARDQETRW